MSLRQDFTFSQTSLRDYADCPRRFYLRYLQQVRWVGVVAEPALEHERHMAQGDEFHQLVHRHAVGVPPERLERLIEDEQVREWWGRYLAWGYRDIPAQRYPEITLTTPLGEHPLAAKFDLLALEAGGRAIILDWKTGTRRLNKARMAAALQTVVYRYVLAQAGGALTGAIIPPEAITMIYWNTADGSALELPYDAAQMAADEARLKMLIGEIETLAASASADSFPLTPDVTKCRFCVYRSLCARGARGGEIDLIDADDDDDAPSLALDLDDVPEIAF